MSGHHQDTTTKFLPDFSLAFLGAKKLYVYMRKVWVYQRKNRNGYFVGWYDSGKRHSKMCPNKTIARQFASRLEVKLNDDLYVDPIPKLLTAAIEEYVSFKEEVEGRSAETIRSIKATLGTFSSICAARLTTHINQASIDDFIRKRRPAVSVATLNKDQRNLKTFIHWIAESKYAIVKLKWRMQSEEQRSIKALNHEQLKKLISSCFEVTLLDSNKKPVNQEWFIRVLIAVTSGLRKNDIEKLRFGDVDFEKSTINTFSQKTKKRMADRPLHPMALSVLKKYHLAKGDGVLFTDKFTSGKWDRIRTKAGLPTLKFHDLRRTFASLIAQAGFSTSVVQRLLEHSTPNLTHQIYTDVEPVYRKAVESIVFNIPALPDIHSEKQPSP